MKSSKNTKTNIQILYTGRRLLHIVTIQGNFHGKIVKSKFKKLDSPVGGIFKLTFDVALIPPFVPV
jgi:hypothetical protein